MRLGRNINDQMEGLTSQLVDSLVLGDFVVGSPQGTQGMGDLVKEGDQVLVAPMIEISVRCLLTSVNGKMFANICGTLNCPLQPREPKHCLFLIQTQSSEDVFHYSWRFRKY